MIPAVELVGAGPGDPDLLTLRAEAALAAADLVVTDAAVAHLAHAFTRGADVIVSAAGGGGDRATVDGDTVAVLAGAARRGRRVVRLYRGDPWLHPAYAVESAILASAGIDHRAVPGPAVELAVPALAGLAVHHRPLAATVTIASPTALPPPTDPARTLVTVADDTAGVAARLAGAGDPTLTAATIATAPDARTPVRRGTLAELAADRAIVAGVVVVGAVAATAEVVSG